MPTIHLVRHAQGLHNLSTEAELLRDPELTDLGKEQCADLARRFPVYDGVTHIVASPMRRTLYTALLAFDRVLQSSSSRVTALPLIQEISTQPCDVGSPRSRLEEEFGEKVDFSLISENWYAKGPGSPYAPEMGKLEARARAARVWLRDFVRRGGEDTHVVVVGHGGFLHFFTGDWEGVRPSRGTAWDNTEYRSFEFADPSGRDENASLRETHESSYGRREGAAELSEAEQTQLRAVAQAKLQEELDIVEKEKRGVSFEEHGGVELLI